MTTHKKPNEESQQCVAAEKKEWKKGVKSSLDHGNYIEKGGRRR
jgi:hypothetical protein